MSKKNRDPNEVYQDNRARMLAEGLRPKRPRVEVPLPPPLMATVPKQAKDDNYREWLDLWLAELRERQAKAVLILAKERDADPKELAKVADLLFDVVPPDKRGSPKTINKVAMFLRVATEYRKKGGYTAACQRAGIDPKTFRKYRDDDPRWWNMVRDMAAHFKPRKARQWADYLEGKKDILPK